MISKKKSTKFFENSIGNFFYNIYFLSDILKKKKEFEFIKNESGKDILENYTKRMKEKNLSHKLFILTNKLIASL